MSRIKLLLVLSFAVLILSGLHPDEIRAGELIVSAAASLTDAFSDIEPAFEAANPGVDVIMNFASSGALFRQIEQGAPADVYASANPKWMARAVQSGFIEEKNVRIFAQNTLVLAVPAGNPAHIGSLEDLTGSRVKTIGMGTPETVPAGQYAWAALTRAGLYERLTPKMIYGESVRQILDYLSRGEVDCGFVYRTDVLRVKDRVALIEEIPLENPVTYPMAVLSTSSNPEPARDFVRFVTKEQGALIMQARGFNEP